MFVGGVHVSGRWYTCVTSHEVTRVVVMVKGKRKEKARKRKRNKERVDKVPRVKIEKSVMIHLFNYVRVFITESTTIQ